MQGFIAKLGVKIPIVLAPMTGPVGPTLVAAVSNGVGLGMLPIREKRPAAAVDEMRAVRALTPRSFGVNLNNNHPQDEHLAAALGEG